MYFMCYCLLVKSRVNSLLYPWNNSLNWELYKIMKENNLTDYFFKVSYWLC